MIEPYDFGSQMKKLRISAARRAIPGLTQRSIGEFRRRHRYRAGGLG